MRRVRPILLLAACAQGCTFLRHPVATLFERYAPFTTDSRFSFDAPKGWQGPVPIPGGSAFIEDDGAASISVVFLAPSDPGYRPPDQMRRLMAGWGSLEDLHSVSAVDVTGRPAYRVRYTTHDVPLAKLAGLTTDYAPGPEPAKTPPLPALRSCWGREEADTSSHSQGQFIVTETRIDYQTNCPEARSRAPGGGAPGRKPAEPGRTAARLTEVTMVPDEAGIYLVQFEAPRNPAWDRQGLAWSKGHAEVRRQFLRSLALGGIAQGQGIDYVAKPSAGLPIGERAYFAEQAVKFSNSHRMEASLRDAAPPRAWRRLRWARRIAIVSFSADISIDEGKESPDEGMADAWQALSKDMKSVLLKRMHETFVTQLLRFNPRLTVLDASEVWGNASYAGLPYGSLAAVKGGVSADGSGKAEHRAVAPGGFKCLVAEVPEWAGPAATAETQRGKETLAGLRGMMALLARDLGVDAVATVRAKVRLAAQDGGLVEADGWGLGVDGLAADIWGRNGRILWSGRIDKPLRGDADLPVRYSVEEFWAAISCAYARCCEYLSLKLDSDRH